MKNSFLFLFLVLVISINSHARNNFNIEVGQGFFECTHVKGKFLLGKVAVGCGYGMAKNLVP